MNAPLRNQNTMAFLVGLLFAIGLAFSGMTQPQKVIGFLDIIHWDPSLIFVMVGAIVVHGLSYPLIRKRRTPLLDTKWHVPTRKDITPRLVIGSLLFGVGWGLAGYCPGPALSSVATGDTRTLSFVFFMLLGMLLFKRTEPYLNLKE